MAMHFDSRARAGTRHAAQQEAFRADGLAARLILRRSRHITGPHTLALLSLVLPSINLALDLSRGGDQFPIRSVGA